MIACRKLCIHKANNSFDMLRNCRLLRIDALTWLNGSMIRRIMSSVCREAYEHRGELTLSGKLLIGHSLIKNITGRGCTALWQRRVRRTFTNEDTFEGIMRELRDCFKDHAQGIQQELGGLVSTNLDSIRVTLDIVKEENAAEESERDPEFRQRVADEVAKARSLMGI